jgi:hypothetical protein
MVFLWAGGKGVLLHLSMQDGLRDAAAKACAELE